MTRLILLTAALALAACSAPLTPAQQAGAPPGPVLRFPQPDGTDLVHRYFLRPGEPPHIEVETEPGLWSSHPPVPMSYADYVGHEPEEFA